jgi:hypothetical protein
MGWKGRTLSFTTTGLMNIRSLDQQLVCLIIYMRIRVT